MTAKYILSTVAAFYVLESLSYTALLVLLLNPKCYTLALFSPVLTLTSKCPRLCVRHAELLLDSGCCWH